jgi:hypothetical protein
MNPACLSAGRQGGSFPAEEIVAKEAHKEFLSRHFLFDKNIAA